MKINVEVPPVDAPGLVIFNSPFETENERLENYRFARVMWHEGGEPKKRNYRKNFTTRSTPALLQKTREVLLIKMPMICSGVNPFLVHACLPCLYFNPEYGNDITYTDI